MGDGIAGDRVDEVLEVLVHVSRIRRQGCVEPQGFVEGQRSDDPRGQEDDQRDEEKEDRRAQVRAVEFPVDPAVEGAENAGDDGGPEDRKEKGLEKIEEEDCYQPQDDEEGDVPVFVVSRHIFASRGLAPPRPLNPE